MPLNLRLGTLSNKSWVIAVSRKIFYFSLGRKVINTTADPGVLNASPTFHSKWIVPPHQWACSNRQTSSTFRLRNVGGLCLLFCRYFRRIYSNKSPSSSSYFKIGYVCFFFVNYAWCLLVVRLSLHFFRGLPGLLLPTGDISLAIQIIVPSSIQLICSFHSTFLFQTHLLVLFILHVFLIVYLLFVFFLFLSFC